MPVIARRFTILMLMATIFALAFSALVAQPGRRHLVLQGDSFLACHMQDGCQASL